MAIIRTHQITSSRPDPLGGDPVPVYATPRWVQIDFTAHIPGVGGKALPAGSQIKAELFDEAGTDYAPRDAITIVGQVGGGVLPPITQYTALQVTPVTGGLSYVAVPLLINVADALTISRAGAASLRIDAVEIWRKTPASDGMGGTSDTWVILASTDTDPALLCRVAAGTGWQPEVIEEQRLEQLNRFSVFLPSGTDVTIRDRIVALGVTFEVISVAGPVTAEVERQCSCILVVS